MPFYNEVWCEEYNIRVARLERTVEFHNGTRVRLSYTRPPVVGRTPIPSSARCNRSPEHPQSMTAGLRRVRDPWFYVGDFAHNPQTDEIITDRDVMRNEITQAVFRNVMTVDLSGRPTSVGDVTNKMQRWSQFFAAHGWIPEDPQTVYELWCEAEGVTPDTARPEQQWASETRAKDRLRQLFAARATRCTDEDATRISNRIRAASATENSYRDSMQMLGDAIMDWRPHAVSIRGRDAAPIHRLIQTFLDAEQIADLRVYDMVNHRDTVLTAFDNPFEPMVEPPRHANARSQVVPNPDVVAQIRAATAALPGVRIPTTVAGKRPLNLETPDEVRDPFNAPSRLYLSGSGGGEGNARSARRSLRLDN